MGQKSPEESTATTETMGSYSDLLKQEAEDGIFLNFTAIHLRKIIHGMTASEVTSANFDRSIILQDILTSIEKSIMSTKKNESENLDLGKCSQNSLLGEL